MERITNKISKRSAVTIITFVLIVGAALALYLNRGFYFAEFHTQTKLSITATDENKSNVINDVLSKASNIARVERNKGEIFFEYSTISDIENLAKEASANKEVTYTVNKEFTLESTIQNFIVTSGIIVLTIAGALFYFVLKNNKGISDVSILKVLGILGIASAIANLILLGILSIASRFYQIRTVDLYSLVALNIFLGMLFLSCIWKYRTLELKTVTIFKEEIITALRNQQYTYLKIFALILIVVTLGLGVNFVMSALFILLGFIIAEFALISVVVITNSKFDVAGNLKSAQKRLREARKKQNANKAKIEKGAPIALKSEKKSKPKKKKKAEKKGIKKRK